jgi:ACS family allantoate permease-like MFS transporter
VNNKARSSRYVDVRISVFTIAHDADVPLYEMSAYPSATSDDDRKPDYGKDQINMDCLPQEEIIPGDVLDAGDQFSDAFNRKLLWKIDLWLLPLMWICYGTQQTDKTSLSVQAVFGIREDT